MQVLYPGNLQLHSSDLKGPVYSENHIKLPSLSMPWFSKQALSFATSEFHMLCSHFTQCEPGNRLSPGHFEFFWFYKAFQYVF